MAATWNPLNRIRSDRKRREIEEILNHPSPAHFQRVYLVGFLRYSVGLSEDEICALIKSRAKWRDYNETITRQQIHSIYKRGIAERAKRCDAEGASWSH